MKKFVVALALASGVAIIAYASLNSRSDSKQKQATEKKAEKKEIKKECRRSCLFS